MDTSSDQTAGEKLRAIRIGKSLSIYQLSKLANLSMKTITRIEEGDSVTIKRQTIDKLCKAFEISFDDLWNKLGLELDERTMRGKVI